MSQGTYETLLSRVLLPHQEDWLRRALSQEESASCGGVLPDFFGYESAILLVALILERRSFSCENRKFAGVPTLLLCSPAAVFKWAREIENCSVKGSIKVGFFNEAYMEYDVVLASYNNAESDYWRYLTTKSSQDRPTLHHIRWGRIVFDEELYAKRRGCDNTDAFDTLRSSYSWAVSRPPVFSSRVVKREEDLDVAEKKNYDRLLKKTVATFDAYARVGNVAMKFGYLFELLTELRKAVNGELIRSSSRIINKMHINKLTRGTKIEALKEEIYNMHERDPSAKGIVLSEFPDLIDAVEYTLQQCGVPTIHLHGSMRHDAREAAINKFVEDPDSRFLLTSLKARAIDANLSVASHVFLMEPWWDPVEEKEAHDLVHGFGQYKPTRVIKFVTTNTIEESILQLQDLKKLAFKSGEASEASGKLSGDNLRYLYSRCKDEAKNL